MMPEMKRILSRIESGAKIRIVQDFYGQEFIEIPGRWLPFGRRVKVRHEELTMIKDALGQRRRTARKSATARL